MRTWLTALSIVTAPALAFAQSEPTDSGQQRARGNAFPLTRSLSLPPADAQVKPAPPPLRDVLTLAYFGLFDDRVGPRGITASGRPDGRFVLTVAAGKLTSRDVMYISLQAMDANSRPIGAVWHTRDASQSLLLVVAGDQWLNTKHGDGLATLEGPEVDLILFADDAPAPDAVSAFIVEVGFADGSLARELVKAR